ncbi:hypothetical protein AWQ21_14590 (plasmid) [Picosynechococcus sp. PCC 7003]|uniref:hypothetical protein n=1 Tax=Picosynechococcus sp. PCC 7003 TaxID=374981 RepID=UPI0008103380|nr:hypothetical protein [Picosynechococcus sp. PCC 7003]ANV85759.1 hypothetical protein AWQ21_14590 [Picosynechococcus sp. PCC 7003]
MPIATNIKLDKKTHVYIDTQGKQYTSVSKIINRYKEPFDRMGNAERVSQKTGRSISEILAEWDAAAPYGTAVHKQIENYLLGNTTEIDLIQPYIPKFDALRQSGYKLHLETILHADDVSVAGMADLLIERDDGTWSIFDWKTNKAIYKNSFGGKKLKPPLDHLDDCNYIHYSLQLSLYARMLGKPIHELMIIHIPKGKEELDPILCLNLAEEVELILSEHIKG